MRNIAIRAVCLENIFHILSVIETDKILGSKEAIHGDIHQYAIRNV